MAKQHTYWRKATFTILAIFIILITLIVIGETTARLMGYTPWKPVQKNIRLVPEGNFFIPDPELGFTTRPGTYTVVLDNNFKFYCTNNDEGMRLTQPSWVPVGNKPEIWVLGGSFTYGWGVNNDETYLWKAQERFPTHTLLNFGIPGHGTLQNLLLLKRKLDSGSQPEKVILAYAGFHNERNISSRLWRKNLATFNRLGDLQHPYALLKENGDLKISHQPLQYEPWPYEQKLALVNMLEAKYDTWEHKKLQSEKVTQKLILEIQKECNDREIEFYVMILVTDERSDRVIQFCEEQGIKHFDITVDLRDSSLTNLPYDSHPNGSAHQKYADKLVEFLQTLD